MTSTASQQTALTGSSRCMFSHPDHPRYKWVALSNTTLGMLLATINASIVLISLPAIFNGIGLDPLTPGNVSYLLWMLMGYMLVSAVLVVTLGRLGDIYGRVRIYNAGFLVFTLCSIALSLDPYHGAQGRAVAHRPAGVPGHRRRDDPGQLDRHPDRRVPRLAARHRAGHQHRRRYRRVVHRPRARRRPGGVELAQHLLGQRARRHRRHHLGVPVAARHRRAPPRQDRLVGQRHVRDRPERPAGRHHVRHPALRRPHDGLDQPVGDRRG